MRETCKSERSEARSAYIRFSRWLDLEQRDHGLRRTNAATRQDSVLFSDRIRADNPPAGTCVVIEVSWGRVRRFGDEQ